MKEPPHAARCGGNQGQIHNTGWIGIGCRSNTENSPLSEHRRPMGLLEHEVASPNRREDEINGIIDRRECGLRRVCFLLGAGVSLSAGFPSTDAITNRVRGREGAIRNTGGTYSWSSDPAGIHRHGDGPDCAQQLIETVADMPWGAPPPTMKIYITR